MYKRITKFPGGMLLVPMFLSALFNTLFPGFFHIGGMTEEFLTTKGVNYAIGAALFFSGINLNLRSMVTVMKKQGLIILARMVICLVALFLYFQMFGQGGVLGISALALVPALCSFNPALYLAMASEYGEEEDKNAFGLVGLVAVPANALLVFGLFQPTPIDWMPVVSALIPLVLGIIVGALDADFKTFFAPGIGLMMPLMGWCLGAGINLLDAFKSGFQGVLLALLFYVAALPGTFLFERKVLKSNGVSAMAMTFIAGMSASVPQMIAAENPELWPYVPGAVAQIAMGVVITSIVTPLLIQRLKKSEASSKR